MKALLDTSVLVSAFYPKYPQFPSSIEVLTSLGRKRTFASLHSLAEVYASLTRMPGDNRVRPSNAIRFISSLKENLTLITLTEVEFWRVLETAADLSLASGTVYDALIGECAMKAEVDILYTWNRKHFALLRPEVARIVQSPDPGLVKTQ